MLNPKSQRTNATPAPRGRVAAGLRFVLDNSLLLLAGAVAAMVWANASPASYAAVLHAPLLANPYFGVPADGVAGGGKIIDLHYLVNDILMALFFALAGREVWHALLPGGPLSRARQAATPMLCAVGGMMGPVVLYLAGAAAFGRWDDLARGWAVPTATDIAFSYFVARLIFGKGHPAVAFLLLLAIVDDALGLMILAIFYPQGEVQPAWLLLCVVAVGVCVLLYTLRRRHFLWFLLLAGPLSWAGFAWAGLHPALGLLPIVPMLPHAHLHTWRAGWNFVTPRDAEKFEARMKPPVEIILCLFGLLNAGVLLAAPAGHDLTAAGLVLGGLVVGKPLGIFLTALLATRLGLSLATGLRRRDLLVVGCVAGIGFTVAIFVATVAFPYTTDASKTLQSAAKLGALASFASALVAWLVARLVGVKRRDSHIAT